MPWLLSAKDPAALRRQARKLLGHLDAHPGRWCDAEIAYSLAVTRSAFTHRAAVVGADRGQYLAGLRALADGEPGVGGGETSPWVESGLARTGRTVLVCAAPSADALPSHGSLPWEWTPFRDAVADLDEALAPYADGRSLAELLGPAAGRATDEDAALAGFAVVVAHAWLWQACGVRPTTVVGEGRAGRWAAAHLRGDRTLEAALAGLTGGDEPPPEPARAGAGSAGAGSAGPSSTGAGPAGPGSTGPGPAGPGSTGPGPVSPGPAGPGPVVIELPAAPDAKSPSFARQLGAAFVSGVRLDREAAFGGPGVRPVPLPTYAFAGAHHWWLPPAPPSTPGSTPGSALGSAAANSPVRSPEQR
ncbi:hypothetical protein [Streptomyces sp. NPDC059786]|uniref:CurL C-terminal domain-containing protein n=1 Tax=Streptomyces sp. NPDC059786 TaxID=3346946 RepID=UPI003656D011